MTCQFSQICIHNLSFFSEEDLALPFTFLLNRKFNVNFANVLYWFRLAFVKYVNFRMEKGIHTQRK